MNKLIKDEETMYNALNPFKRQCKKCGHYVYLVRVDKKLCEYCGIYVFKDKKAEFNYRLKESLNKL